MTAASTPSAVAIQGPSLAAAGDYLALLKPRVMSLVIFTALTGMIMAPGHLHGVIAAIALLCIAIGAGASGALNMWFDADIDAKMERTRTRPVPSGKVLPGEALAFGLTMAIGAVLILGLMVNLLAAALLAFTIFFYAVVYTIWLKRSTPQNIVIGGAAGALPPVIGWAAVSGSIELGSVLLFLIIFLWTPPHFWALALVKSDEYAKAGVPMLPVVAGKKATRRQILFYSLILAPVGVLPTLFGYASPAFGISAAVLGLGMVVLAVRVLRSESRGFAAEKQLFRFSIFYLFSLFAMLIGDHVLAAAFFS